MQFTAVQTQLIQSFFRLCRIELIPGQDHYVDTEDFAEAHRVYGVQYVLHHGEAIDRLSEVQFNLYNKMQNAFCCAHHTNGQSCALDTDDELNNDHQCTVVQEVFRTLILEYDQKYPEEQILKFPGVQHTKEASSVLTLSDMFQESRRANLRLIAKLFIPNRIGQSVCVISVAGCPNQTL
jgi:hypothetical protein